jgi:hypothetical protein
MASCRKKGSPRRLSSSTSSSDEILQYDLQGERGAGGGAVLPLVADVKISASETLGPSPEGGREALDC